VKEMNKLIERYVYAVVSKLPVNQRKDIAEELVTLIDDLLLNDKSDLSEDNKIENVLLELGNPNLLVEQYRDKKRYLIGPKNFDNYISILKIVFIAVFIGITISSIIGGFLSNQSYELILGNYLSILFNAFLQAFAWVTIIFGVVEYHHIDIDQFDKNEEWSLKKLPIIPNIKANISLADPIISIVLSTIFTCILYFSPEIIAAYFQKKTGGYHIIPVFDIAILRGYQGLIIAMYVLTVMKEILKLIQRRWTLRLALITSVFTIGVMVLTFIVFLDPSIWNANFFESINSILDKPITVITPGWKQLTSIIVTLIVIFTSIDIIKNIYKGYKYSNKI